MNMEKPYQKSCLMMEFGILIQPYEELAQIQSVPEIRDYRIAFAKVNSGTSQFLPRIDEFVTFGDTKFSLELKKMSRMPTLFSNQYGNLSEIVRRTSLDILHDKFKEDFKKLKLEFIDTVDSIPIDWQPEIFQANTPFTAYCCILDCTTGVRQRFHYFDRYLNVDFFSLYLRNLDRSVSIRLVTTEGRKGKNGFGVNEIIDVSDLCRREFDDYKLIQLDPTDFHDRNLRIDEQIFTLGPGTTKAGTMPTNFGPADSSPQAIKILDDLIAKGKVIHES
jgi:hypothetical protein